MAIKKLNKRGVIALSAMPTPRENGEANTVLITHTLGETVAIGDIVEIAALPGECRLIAADIAAENVTGNIDVGIMSGVVDSIDPARTCGSEIFAAQAAGTAASATLVKLAALGVNAGNRSIGVKFAAENTAGATKKVHLRLTYAAQPGR